MIGGEDDDGVRRAGVVDEGDEWRDGNADVGEMRGGKGEGVRSELARDNMVSELERGEIQRRTREHKSMTEAAEEHEAPSVCWPT